MQFSQEDIRIFKEVFYRNEGREISDMEALNRMTSLILMFKAAYRPIPAADKGKLEKLKDGN